MELTVVGWPRSGTHWLKALLEEALGQEVAHQHRIPTVFTDAKRYVFTVRDPRDAFCSHYRQHLHDHSGEPESQIGLLKKLFIGRELPPYTVWKEHTEQLLAIRSPFVVKTSHEALKQDAATELARIIGCLSLEAPSWKEAVAVVQVVAQRRCDPTTLPYTHDMGQVGRWQSELRKDANDLLVAYCGGLMHQLGYK